MSELITLDVGDAEKITLQVVPASVLIDTINRVTFEAMRMLEACSTVRNLGRDNFIEEAVARIHDYRNLIMNDHVRTHREVICNIIDEANAEFPEGLVIHLTSDLNEDPTKRKVTLSCPSINWVKQYYYTEFNENMRDDIATIWDAMPESYGRYIKRMRVGIVVSQDTYDTFVNVIKKIKNHPCNL